MSVDFAQALAAAVGQQQGNSGRKAAEFWMNIGVKNTDGVFVGLGGIPLDGIKEMGGSGQYAATHNSLLSLVLGKAQQLAPGAVHEIPAGSFVVQLRRVGGEKTTASTAGLSPERLALFAEGQLEGGCS